MKALKLKLYQETVCYKKPISFKVTETYPLPPYSTIIGFLYNIIDAKSGDRYDMNVSIQGEYESILNSFNTLRFYKANSITTRPINVNMLFGVNLIIHVVADEELLEKIVDGFKKKNETFTLGRREDLVRLDYIGYVELNEITEEDEDYLNDGYILRHSIYIPNSYNATTSGIGFRLNKNYDVVNGIRKWEKVEAKYVEEGNKIIEIPILIDNSNEKDIVFLG